MAAKKRGRKKKISLGEFKAWIEGVEELQADAWAPNREQWTLIREKMDCIAEPEPTKVTETAAPAPAPAAVRAGPGRVPATAIPGVAPAPEIPSSIPPIAPESAAQFGTEGSASKTPDVEGDYTDSPFA